MSTVKRDKRIAAREKHRRRCNKKQEHLNRGMVVMMQTNSSFGGVRSKAVVLPKAL